ncbi:hypothetical protein BDR07DRAFT_1427772 [Suillus spraguei]|nr:hypothetical protein BDR07DRAFT_1427772 [Suillus spraguei]
MENAAHFNSHRVQQCSLHAYALLMWHHRSGGIMTVQFESSWLRICASFEQLKIIASEGSHMESPSVLIGWLVPYSWYFTAAVLLAHADASRVVQDSRGAKRMSTLIMPINHRVSHNDVGII